MSDQIIFAFDCARRDRSVAIVDLDGEPIGCASGSDAASGAGLLPLAKRLMNHHRVVRQKVAAISVTRGPGSFTGVRVGLATAMGVAVALEIPVFGVSTLRALCRAAEEAIAGRGDLLPVAVLPAGRGYLFLGFEEGGDFRECRVAREEIPAGLPRETGLLFAGEGMRPDQLASLGSSLVAPLPPLAPIVGALGALRLASGERGDPASLKARYLRGSGARLPRQVSEDAAGISGISC